MKIGALFQKHAATGFDAGWHRDIPKFEPEDWRDFLLRAAVLWALEVNKSDCMKLHYVELRETISEEFWEKSGAKDPRRQVHILLENMRYPFGLLHYIGPEYDVYGMTDLLATWHDKQADNVKTVFRQGLDLAIPLDKSGFGTLKNARDWIGYLKPA
jgi:hypothetical protein